MNLKDIRLGKKLGPTFFESLDSLSKEQVLFTEYKRSISIRMEETLENDDSEKGLSQFNSEVISFWGYAFRFKYAYYVNSAICNSIATEKADRIFSSQLALKILNDNSLEDARSLFVCIRHYEILAEYYYASHLDSLGEAGFNELSRFMKAKKIEDIATHVLKEFFDNKVVTSLNTNITLHYLRLFEESVQIFSKGKGLKISDSDLLNYRSTLKQSFHRRGLETSETCGREIYDFITDSFNPANSLANG
jgi:hypothetical protein